MDTETYAPVSDGALLEAVAGALQSSNGPMSVTGLRFAVEARLPLVCPERIRTAVFAMIRARQLGLTSELRVYR